MVKTTVFKSNRTQAVRIPKALAFPASVKSVEIVKEGRSLKITPAGNSLEEFFNSPGIGDDFMSDYKQPEMQFRKEY